MAKLYYYLLDKLNPENSETLKKALKASSNILGVETKIRQGVVEIKAGRDPSKELIMACGIAGVTFRMEVKKRDVF